MTFLHVQDEKPFLANRIWQMANRFGEGHINLANFNSHYMQSLMQNVGEIEQGIFFCQKLCTGDFLLGAQSLVKLTLGQ